MLIGLGKKVQADGISELLLACHQRIRSFIGVALRLANAPEAPEEEIREAAQGVQRYFEQALPLHVADEEHSVLPRLRGREAALDAALDRMHAEHASHEPRLAELVTCCRALAQAPQRHASLRQALGDVARELERDLEAHLRHEELLILPAIGRLIDVEEQAQMVAELRARRQ